MSEVIHSPAAIKGRGRWQLIFLLLIVLGPMFLGAAMYHWQFWVPEGRNYHGELIGDGRGLGEVGVQGGAAAQWQLLVTNSGECREQCQQLIYQVRQINIGLNRDASRAQHAVALSQPLEQVDELRLRTEYPQLKYYALDPQVYDLHYSKVQLWIVDPLGNLVLRYDADTPGKAILNDLRLLLKLSQIG